MTMIFLGERHHGSTRSVFSRGRHLGPAFLHRSVIVAVWLISAADTSAALRFDTIALTGSPAPGLAGEDFVFLEGPVLSQRGDVAYYGRTEVDGAETRGIWFGRPGDLEPAARNGDPAAGIEGALFADFRVPVLSPGGKLAFRGRLEVGVGDVDSDDDSGIWSGPPGSPDAWVREGSGASGTAGVFPDLFIDTPANSTLTVGDSGAVPFWADLVLNPEGIWIVSPEGVEPLAQAGWVAPGTGAEFHFLFRLVTMNSTGDVAFGATLRANSSENQGTWLGRIGEVDLLSRDGQTAPGTEGEAFLGTRSPDLNDNGTAIFASGLADLAGSGIWMGVPGAVELVSKTGLAAPGTSGATFDSFTEPLFTSDRPVINSVDTVAFFATLKVEPGSATADNNLGLWMGTPDDLQLVARKGATAPGTQGAQFTSFAELSLNGHGDVAFTADLLIDGDVSPANDHGLWLWANGRPLLVAREGDLFDVDPTSGVDLREILSIDFQGGSGGEDGRPLALIDRRTLVFQLGFTDGTSGIFTAQVPEPSSMLLAAAVAMSLLIARIRLSSPRQSRVDVPS